MENNTEYEQIMKDPKVSFKAKGLLSYFMLYPMPWNLSVKDLSMVSSDGNHSIYSAIKELLDGGYIKKTQKNDSGHFGSIFYELLKNKGDKIGHN